MSSTVSLDSLKSSRSISKTLQIDQLKSKLQTFRLG